MSSFTVQSARGKRRPFTDRFSSPSEERHHALTCFISVFIVMMLVSACNSGGGGIFSGDGGGSGDNRGSGVITIPTYTVGGVVSGLTGTVVFQNNRADDLTVGASGPFVFSTHVKAGSTYVVTVKTQPAGQTCSVVKGTGVIPGMDIDTVRVTCSEFTHTVSGIVSGLSGTVVLQNNDTDLLTIVSDGTFTFIPLADGTPYEVTARAEPENQACAVGNNSGTLSGADVAVVTVTCQDALAWDAPFSDTGGSIMADVAGYKIYYGAEPGVYTGSIDVGNKTRYPTSDFFAAVIDRSIPYYITVTAYDAGKTTESAYSNEIARNKPAGPISKSFIKRKGTVPQDSPEQSMEKAKHRPILHASSKSSLKAPLKQDSTRGPVTAPGMRERGPSFRGLY